MGWIKSGMEGRKGSLGVGEGGMEEGEGLRMEEEDGEERGGCGIWEGRRRMEGSGLGAWVDEGKGEGEWGTGDGGRGWRGEGMWVWGGGRGRRGIGMWIRGQRKRMEGSKEVGLGMEEDDGEEQGCGFGDGGRGQRGAGMWVRGWGEEGLGPSWEDDGGMKASGEGAALAPWLIPCPQPVLGKSGLPQGPSEQKVAVVAVDDCDTGMALKFGPMLGNYSCAAQGTQSGSKK